MVFYNGKDIYMRLPQLKTMITVRSYKSNNKIETTAIDKTNFLKKTIWIDCENPTEKEISEVAKRTGIRKGDISDCLDQSEKPRLQRDQKYFFFILGVPLRKDGKEIAISPMGIFISKRFLVTVHKFKVKALNDFVKKEESLKEIFKLGIERVVYNLLMSVVKEFYLTIEEIEQDSEKIETKVVKPSNSVLHDILALKKNLLYIRRTFMNNREVISSIKESTLIKKRDLFQDLYVEFVQQVDMIEILRERLIVALEIYYSSISNRLNEVMKYFTVIASLILLPTLISGIYGMNFLALPLKEHLYGFWIMLGIMLTSMLIMFYFFKRKRWI